MAVVERKRKGGGVSYFVVFTWQGKDVWEKVDSGERREADRLDARRKREIKAGTYKPEKARRATSFAQWAGQWAQNRRNRNAEIDRKLVEVWIVSCEWLARMPLEDVRPRHVDRFVDELKTRPSKQTGRPLVGKSIANVYGLLRTMLADAYRLELITSNPCVLARGKIRRKTKKRAPYDLDSMRSLLSSETIAPDVRVFIALLFFTGMREGEACGRRWADWDPNAEPLGALHVHTQYNDQPLKTEDEVGEAPRLVPVHPELARVLEWWKREGWELVFGRKPTDRDFIVPRRERGTRELLNHTKSSAYKAWRKACDASGVMNRTMHATRHTFITFCRRGGARDDVLERVTHNAAGKVIDIYTHFDWAPLCEQVLCFGVRSRFDGTSKTPANLVEALGIEPSKENANGRETTAADANNCTDEPPPIRRGFRGDAANLAAIQESAAVAPLARATQGLARLAALEATTGEAFALAEDLGVELPKVGAR